MTWTPCLLLSLSENTALHKYFKDSFIILINLKTFGTTSNLKKLANNWKKLAKNLKKIGKNLKKIGKKNLKKIGINLKKIGKKTRFFRPRSDNQTPKRPRLTPALAQLADLVDLTNFKASILPSRVAHDKA